MKYVSLIISVVTMNSCTYTSRDNYDSWIIDEDVCRELVKVEKSNVAFPYVSGFFIFGQPLPLSHR